MPVELTGRNLIVTPAARRRAEKIVGRLERHLDGPTDTRVVVWREKHIFLAEAITKHRRRRWTAQEERGDMVSAIAFALEKIDAHARKDTEKRRDRRQQGETDKTAR